MAKSISINAAAIVGVSIKEKGDSTIGELKVQFRTTEQNMNLFNDLAEKTGEGYSQIVEITGNQQELPLDGEDEDE